MFYSSREASITCFASSGVRVCAHTADKISLIPDNCLSYEVRIGGVTAYRGNKGWRSGV